MVIFTIFAFPRLPPTVGEVAYKETKEEGVVHEQVKSTARRSMVNSMFVYFYIFT